MNQIPDLKRNTDRKVTEGFGDEWTRFDQSKLEFGEKQQIFNDYFSIFPWENLPAHAIGADIGCGSGRWASVVASRAAILYCIDGSPSALSVAKRNLQEFDNCRYIEAQVDDLGLPPLSLDFAYSLGVLHHVPDTLAGIKSCVATLKVGAPFLLYLYHRLDTRPIWYRWIWAVSDVLRRLISGLPYSLRYIASQLLALTIYWPLARSGKALLAIGFNINDWPLAYYADKSFYVMRTDALDRFGTSLEQRFNQTEIHSMMSAAGLTNIRFSDRPPYWCAVGSKIAAE
jgi:ubiquinone/menaquinone biosynthesis C-methylase UbiE